jgi:hypothetical protein
MFRRPTFTDVLRARRIVSRYLPRTPLLPSLSLSRLLGCQLYLKFENHQPIGAFKVRFRPRDGRTRPGGHHGLDGESRAIHRLCGAELWGTSGHRHA